LPLAEEIDLPDGVAVLAGPPTWANVPEGWIAVAHRRFARAPVLGGPMKRLLLTLFVVLPVLGCENSSSLRLPTGPTEATPTPPRTYTLAGAVRDSANVAVSGVKVEVTNSRFANSPYAGRFSLTDENGRFRITDVSGTLEVRGSKDGFFPTFRLLNVDRDTALDLRLEPIVHLAVGTTVSGTVRADGPVCYPLWDAQSRCQQFVLTTPADGTLEMTLVWNGSTALELLLMGDDESYPLAYAPDPSPNRLTAAVRRGIAYEVRVLAYVTQSFELTVALD
jgi:Carboxypeptidase regulatory-like domain